MEFFSRRCPPTGPIHQWTSGQQGWSWVQHATQECCWISEAPGDDKSSTHWRKNLWSYLNQGFGASLVTQMVKNPPTMQETQVWSLGWEDPLEKRMATHSGILAWRIPWQRSLAGYSPRGRKESDMTATNTFGRYLKEKKPKFSSWKHSFFLKAHLPHLGLNRDGGGG